MSSLIIEIIKLLGPKMSAFLINVQSEGEIVGALQH